MIFTYSLLLLYCLTTVIVESNAPCWTRKGKLGICLLSCNGDSLWKVEDNACNMAGGGLGRCCMNSTTKNGVKSKTETPIMVNLSDISSNNPNNLIRNIRPWRMISKRSENSLSVQFQKPVYFHQMFNAPKNISIQIDVDANFFLDVTKTFLAARNLTFRQARNLFEHKTNNKLQRRCTWHPLPICNHKSKYRTLDGTCNNIKNPNYGRTGTPFQRLLPPEYDEKTIDLPRRRGKYRELPAVRDVSNKLAGGNNRKYHDNTILLMQMGQFIAHDLSHTPSFANKICCRDNNFPDSYNSEECFPINLKKNDTFWKGIKSCMEFTRSLKAPGLNCELGNREQSNQITHWLDGSNIYGSTQQEAELLKAERGKLKVSEHSGGKHSYLPNCMGKPKGRIEACDLCEERNNKDKDSKKDSCYYAGDLRVNEQLNLIVVHTLFMMEHNRVANRLGAMNPCWSDNKLYQEARRITVAQYQHIVYKEWLPIIIGNEFMDVYGLWPRSSGYSFDFDDNFDPRISNEFATAAFRFGHSLIPDTFQLGKTVNNKQVDSRKITRSLKIRDTFFRPEALKVMGTLERLLFGMTQQQRNTANKLFAEDIRNHLFESKEGFGGLDLVALNIQRGRDHGLSGYNNYREYCGMGRATRWTDLEDNILPDHIDKIRQLYDSIEDIDLFVGGVLEKPHHDALVGPIFKCLITDQFTRLKKGDRFFYDLGTDSNIKFTKLQLDEIRKTSFSRLICNNMASMGRIQPFAFKLPNSPVNQPLACSSTGIDSISLTVFRDSSCPMPQNYSTEQILVCSTVAGPDVGSGCVLPFRYKNILFSGCTNVDDPDGKLWCSTRTDANENHIGQQGHWGYCHASCPIETRGL